LDSFGRVRNNPRCIPADILGLYRQLMLAQLGREPPPDRLRHPLGVRG